ncbi:CLUMA_CG019613, isoform A [Clunio marinus]|uniref:CLUMA_CG019613, isoform A n=1 Tax=Clunio marinus TaxID=568069 RepID=A0A1J1J2U0_9DIPT|nr:CLUMA_CG019613, isoform A [Clunio marinus]
MASSPAAIQKFERNVPRVTYCCFFFDMNVGGTLLSLFGIITGFAYLARSLHVLYNIHAFEMGLGEDDALNNEDDNIWVVYISTMFVGFFFVIVSIFMLYGSTKRMAHHVFPYLIGILLSTFWSIVLGTIEVFDSDMDLALGYFIFAAFQFYLWVCAVSLYRDLIEVEQNPNKPTRTTV